MYLVRFLLILGMGYATAEGYAQTVHHLPFGWQSEVVRPFLIFGAAFGFFSSMIAVLIRRATGKFDRKCLTLGIGLAYMALVCAASAIELKPMFTQSFQGWFWTLFFSVPFIFCAGNLAQAKYAGTEAPA